MDKLTALGFKPSGGSQSQKTVVSPELAKLGFKPSGETANVSQETKPIGNEPSYLQRVGQQLSENVLGAPQKAFQESLGWGAGFLFSFGVEFIALLGVS